MNDGTTLNPSAVKKLMQVSEEVQKPVHVPVVLGNECYVVTQQDIRKIEDIRLLSYHKLGPNGELIPVEAVLGQEAALKDAILNAAAFQNHNQSDAATRYLLEILSKCCGNCFSNESSPQQIQTKASIAQQMEWANSCSSSSPAFPFTYSKSTSVDELPRLPHPPTCCNNPCCCSCSCQTKHVASQGCNTTEDDPNSAECEGVLSARNMLKIRKTIEDTLGI